MQRNKRLFAPFFAVKMANVYVPFLQAFLLALDMSEPMVLYVVMATFTVAGLLEVPTGWVADAFGRKASIIMGACIALAACVVYATLPAQGSYLLFGAFLAAGLLGLGNSLITGADWALVYETYAGTGEESEAEAAGRRLNGISGLSEAAASFAGIGLYIAMGYRGILLVQAVLFLAVLVIALFFVEPRHAVAVAESPGDDTYRLPVRRLWPLMLFGAFASGLSGLLVWLTPYYYMYATGWGIGEGENGWAYNVVWGLLLSSLFLFKYGHRLLSRQRLHALITLIAVAAVSYTGMVLTTGLVGVAFIFGTYFVRAIMLPAIEQMVNERVANRRRATMQSLRRTITAVVSAGSLGVSTLVLNHTGSVLWAVAVVGVIAVGGSAVTLVWAQRRGLVARAAG